MRDPFALAPVAPQEVKPQQPKTKLPQKFYVILGVIVALIVVVFVVMIFKLRGSVSADVASTNYSISSKIDLPQEKKYISGDDLSTSLTISSAKSDVDSFALIYGLGIDLTPTLSLNSGLSQDQIGYTRKITSKESEDFSEEGGNGIYLNVGEIGEGQAKSFPIRLTVFGGSGSDVQIIIKVFNRVTTSSSCGTLKLKTCQNINNVQIGIDSFKYRLSSQAKVVLKPGYNFITLPYILTTDGAKTFINSISSHWAYYFKTDTSEFLDLKNESNLSYIKPGSGFWVYSEKGEDIILPDSKAEIGTGESFSVPLNIGWNYIGNPFTKTIILSANQVLFRELAEDGSPTGAIYSYKSAVDNSILSLPYILTAKGLTDSSGQLTDLSKLMEWKILPFESNIKPFIGVIVQSQKKGNLILSGKDIITACGKIADDEWRKIQNWLGQNGLNQYGDPQGTVYSQGAPVDAAGQMQDQCDYILKNHPDRPWLTVR